MYLFENTLCSNVFECLLAKCPQIRALRSLEWETTKGLGSRYWFDSYTNRAMVGKMGRGEALVDREGGSRDVPLSQAYMLHVPLDSPLV